MPITGPAEVERYEAYAFRSFSPGETTNFCWKTLSLPPSAKTFVPCASLAKAASVALGLVLTVSKDYMRVNKNFISYETSNHRHHKQPNPLCNKYKVSDSYLFYAMLYFSSSNW